MMKRVFALILAGALSVSLFAGCGGNKEPAAEGFNPRRERRGQRGRRRCRACGRDRVLDPGHRAPWKGWFDPGDRGVPAAEPPTLR